MNQQFNKFSRGFTLVELMVALVLGLLLGGAIITIFIENRRGFDRDETLMRMQDDARQAIREIANDLSMAGFWAVVCNTCGGSGQAYSADVPGARAKAVAAWNECEEL